MFSANEAKSLTERDRYLMEIEDRIKEVSMNGGRSITLTVGDWNEKDFQRISPILRKNGYSIEISGCAGWTSYYYKISWY